MALNEEVKDPNFYVDLGATTHIKNDLGNMSQVIPYKGHDAIFCWKWRSFKNLIYC